MTIEVFMYSLDVNNKTRQALWCVFGRQLIESYLRSTNREETIKLYIQ